MFFDFLNSDRGIIEEKYWPFIYLFEISVVAYIMVEFKKTGYASESYFLSCLKCDVISQLHIPSFVAKPSDKIIEEYLSVQLSPLKKLAKSIFDDNENGRTIRMPVLSRRLFLSIINQSPSFKTFSLQDSAYQEGKREGEKTASINVQCLDIMKILQRRLDTLSPNEEDMLIDSLVLIKQSNQLEQLFHYALECSTVNEFMEYMKTFKE